MVFLLGGKKFAEHNTWVSNVCSGNVSLLRKLLYPV